jgi:hypothetical protein
LHPAGGRRLRYFTAPRAALALPLGSARGRGAASLTGSRKSTKRPCTALPILPDFCASRGC